MVASTIPERVDAVAARHPEATAVVGTESRLTYRELVAAARAWVRVLVAYGVAPGDVVAVRAGRGPDLAAALLGVLSAGACYSVIDPDWPAGRQQDLLTRMGARLCLVSDHSSVLSAPGIVAVPLRLAADLSVAPGEEPVAVSPDAPACIFFTSGSTGRPKGVLSPHRATTRLFAGDPKLRGGPGVVMVSAAPPAWDGFTLEFWSMLTTGGCTIMHEPTYFLPSDLQEAVRRHGVTDVFLTAGLFSVFAAEDMSVFGGLQRVTVGGDRLSTTHARAFVEAHPDVWLVNGYGPVECCGFVTTHRVVSQDVDRPEGVPIGIAVPGTEVLVVDGDGRVVSCGQEGEIWVTGQGVGLGYVADPTRTAESFRTIDDGSGSRVAYRTGDRGRMNPDGTLAFLGRTDRQVKIAGHRIEPAEVEAAVLHLGCRHVAAVAVPAAQGYRGLALFAVPGAFMGTPRDLRSALAQQLPASLVPWPITFVPELPLTGNGKVDRAALMARLASGQPA